MSEEYDTDTLPIYSIDEIDKLFSIESSKNPFNILSHGGQGQGNACNFSVKHRILDNHVLHVLYYNFQRSLNNYFIPYLRIFYQLYWYKFYLIKVKNNWE